MLRLADETLLIELCELLYTYFNTGNGLDMKSAATMALMCVEHMYYKHDSMAVAVQRSNAFGKAFGRYADLHPASISKEGLSSNGSAVGSRDATRVHPASFLGTPTIPPVEYDPSARVDELCKYIFRHGDDRSKTRALLCAVYHHALHDRYYHARDLFLISHVQESIDKADTETQILYNRALVTQGLAAFRLGLVNKAHECLSGICSGRVRDLLAQGHTKYFDRDPEQEKIERRRQMPYHMHINPDLLESCHLISAMLLELPILSKPAGTYQGFVSKQFRKYLNMYSQQLFTGPPENTRDLVMSAARALLAGDWKKACSLLLGSDVWNLIPNEGGERVKDMLRLRIKEEAVRVFLLNYGAHYESISLAHLCTMFDMDEGTARKIVSKMIHSREVSGAWEQPADVLVLYKVDPSPLQSLCLVVAEKVALLVESNERLLDPLAGAYGYKDDWASKDARGKYAEAGPRSKQGAWKGQNANRYPPARIQQQGGQQQGSRPGRGRGGYSRDGARDGGKSRVFVGDRQQAKPRMTQPSGPSAASDAQLPGRSGPSFRWGSNA